MRTLTKAERDEHGFTENDEVLAFVQPISIGANAKNPRIGCAGIVRSGSEVLLGRRNKDPNRGLWVLPGGGVGFGETLADTLRRELREEAGIEATVENLFDVYELITPPDEHRIIVYLNARHCSGEPTASSDLSDARFFSSEEIQRMSAHNSSRHPRKESCVKLRFFSIVAA